MIGQRKSLRIVGGTDIPQPTFEATLDEKLVIKRFLDFAVEDVKFQLKAILKQANRNLHELQEIQHTAVLVSAYLWKLKGGVDEMKISEPVADAVH